MGIFVFAFTATGKTNVAKKYKNVIDMESSLYKYVGNNLEDEALKSTSRKLNKEWPENYFKALQEMKDKYDYILVADEICNDFIINNSYEYWHVYPKRELKDEYLNRCKKRGNNKEFIYWYSKLWDEWIDKCEEDKYASKKIKLNSNEYLEDVLPNLILKN